MSDGSMSALAIIALTAQVHSAEHGSKANIS